MPLTQLELQRSAGKRHGSSLLLPSCDNDDDDDTFQQGPKENNTYAAASNYDDPLELLQNQEEFSEMSISARSIPLLTIDASRENLPGCADEIRISNSTATKDKLHGKARRPSSAAQHSDELPRWVLTVTQKLLGIATGPGETFRVATTLHVLTFATGLAFIITYSWFIFHDISSVQTKRDALNGIVSIIISIFWTSLAVYSNCLAYRMFDHKTFIQNFRLHSKSVLKCNAALVLFVGGLVFITLNDYGSVVEFDDVTCVLVELDVIVCKMMYVSRVAFSFFALLWNMLVALVLLAVCRTHTMGIRKFIRRLRLDANIQSLKHRQKYPVKQEKSSKHEDQKFTSVFYFNKRISFRPDNEQSSLSNTEMESPVARVAMPPSHDSDDETLLDIPNHIASGDGDVGKSTFDGTPKSFHAPYSDARDVKLPVDRNGTGASSSGQELSLEEILHHYWSLQSDIWITSNTLQRWMLCFVCLCLIWIAVMLIHWLSTSPQTLDVVLFVIPLVMLPVLCSAYAEVNNESQRMSRTIFPSEERLWMLFYFQQAPLQMTIYGYPIKYSTVVTSIFGLVAALTSGIVLQEIKAL